MSHLQNVLKTQAIKGDALNYFLNILTDFFFLSDAHRSLREWGLNWSKDISLPGARVLIRHLIFYGTFFSAVSHLNVLGSNSYIFTWRIRNVVVFSNVSLQLHTDFFFYWKKVSFSRKVAWELDYTDVPLVSWLESFTGELSTKRAWESSSLVYPVLRKACHCTTTWQGSWLSSSSGQLLKCNSSQTAGDHSCPRRIHPPSHQSTKWQEGTVSCGGNHSSPHQHHQQENSPITPYTPLGRPKGVQEWGVEALSCCRWQPASPHTTSGCPRSWRSQKPGMQRLLLAQFPLAAPPPSWVAISKLMAGSWVPKPHFQLPPFQLLPHHSAGWQGWQGETGRSPLPFLETQDCLVWETSSCCFPHHPVYRKRGAAIPHSSKFRVTPVSGR